MREAQEKQARERAVSEAQEKTAARAVAAAAAEAAAEAAAQAAAEAAGQAGGSSSDDAGEAAHCPPPAGFTIKAGDTVAYMDYSEPKAQSAGYWRTNTGSTVCSSREGMCSTNARFSGI